jgi:gamma-glutamyl:cysteine ligase YbdK (ATP-grasp superfamily)
MFRGLKSVGIDGPRMSRPEPTSELAGEVANALEVDREAFQARANEETAVVKEELDAGTFDNPQAMIGLEYEFYAVDAETRALARVPRRLLEFLGFEKELGLHNAEICANPQPFNEYGLHAKESEIRAQVLTALRSIDAEGLRLISDGMWTIPPANTDARSYLTSYVDDNGVRIGTNMSASVRYHAMGNTTEEGAVVMNVDAPNVSLPAETVMPESLITSIQPHYQVRQASDLPQYFKYALRVAGPLLALGVNSPFFPPDLYDEGVSPERIVEEAWMENRINVFEAILNPDGGRSKVRFPRDLDSAEEAVDRVARDTTIVPMPIERSDRFDDVFRTLRLKHGTYWRWVRPVFDGPTRSAANVRIEFRPIPGQPTIRDSIAFLAVFAGLMESLPMREHPVADLEWRHAHDNFYRAMGEGLAGKQVWITNDGRETSDPREIYEDIFAHAKDGLTRRGLSENEAAKYLWPLRQRVRRGITPAAWKKAAVTDRLEEGATLTEAVSGMQSAYIDNQEKTLLEGGFTDWL